ncbi:ATP-binding protein [Corynebacterium uterequi]|nr:AAA family ATPase [Corynebacterium uterequi]
MVYLERAIDQRLDTLEHIFSAVAIEGPKAVGKTETARRRVRNVFRMDVPDDRSRFLATNLVEETRRGPILIDEWQLLPESWDMVRRAVDDGAPKGSVYLTGSSTPVDGVTTHSGAGRIASVRLRPLGLCELVEKDGAVLLSELLTQTAQLRGESDWQLSDYVRSLATSGLPGLIGLTPPASDEYLAAYIERIVDRELPSQGYTVRNKAGLRAWLRAYARATGTDASYSEILAAATRGEGNAPSKRTTALYREKLSEIWMLDPLEAWESSVYRIPRQTFSPKHFLADAAFSLHLSSISARHLNSGKHATHLGRFFEAYAVHSLRVAASAYGLRAGHVRTKSGDREVDLVLETHDGGVLAFEVKLSAVVRDEDVRHLLWLRELIGDDLIDMAIINTGKHAYRRPDGVAVIPLSLLAV